MKIPIDKIPEHGRDAVIGLASPWSRDAAREGLDGEPSALEGKLLLVRQRAHILVTGELRSEHAATCSRCLADLVVELSGELDLEYAPLSEQVVEADRELEEEELDLGWFDGDSLDLAQVLCEQLSLWLPARILCGDEGVRRVTEGPCTLPEQDEGPGPGRHRPFANLSLPE